MPVVYRKPGRLTLAALILLAAPVLTAQISRSLQWHLEQQPASIPCSSDDLAFVNAPEQVALEKSYNLLPKLPAPGVSSIYEWQCESISSPAFNKARVLIISRPSVLEDGVAYTLILPRGSTSARLLPFASGGNLLDVGTVGDWHDRAAMNAMLQATEYGEPDTIDWLALSLAYLTIVGNAPDLADRHYSPKPGESFKPYTVTGLLAELPDLKRKHLLPTLECDKYNYCKIRFYYRTEPVMPLQVAELTFCLQARTLTLLVADVQEYQQRDKARRHSRR